MGTWLFVLTLNSLEEVSFVLQYPFNNLKSYAVFTSPALTVPNWWWWEQQVCGTWVSVLSFLELIPKV